MLKNNKYSIKKRLLIMCGLLLLIIATFTTFIYYKSSYKIYSERVTTDLMNHAKLLSDLLKDESNINKIKTTLDKYSEELEVRITIVDENGYVKSDTEGDTTQMDNHKYRPEINDALKGKNGSSIRYSRTVNTDYVYVAVPFRLSEFTGVIRLSVPLNDIKDFGQQLIKISFIISIIGILVILLIYYFYILKLTKPLDELTEAAIGISNGNYKQYITSYKDPQFSKLSEAFNNMTYRLNDNIMKLKDRNLELESILKSMINGIIAVDKDKKIMLYNNVFTEIIEIKPDMNLKSKHIYNVFRNQSIYDIIDKVFDTETYQNEIIDYGSKDRKLKIYANPIKSETDDEIIGVLIVVQDITQLNKLENIRRQFVSNVTHELKTPLTSIRGFVDTLKNGAIEDKNVAIRFLDIIDIESERLYRLIHDILVLSEIENTKDNNHPVGLYDVEELISEIQPILQQKADNKTIKLIVDISKDLPQLRCNKDRIKQMLINLIDNAIKYTENGYVKLTVSKTQTHMRFNIKDTGIGIKQEDIPRLFERFYRVDKGRSRKMGGTGLGLSIVKHIVELYNGKIYVKSDVNEGTEFIVMLPL